jgi:hypothetical protein
VIVTASGQLYTPGMGASCGRAVRQPATSIATTAPNTASVEMALLLAETFMRSLPSVECRYAVDPTYTVLSCTIQTTILETCCPCHMYDQRMYARIVLTVVWSPPYEINRSPPPATSFEAAGQFYGPRFFNLYVVFAIVPQGRSHVHTVSGARRWRGGSSS